MKHFKSLLLLSTLTLASIASFSFLPIDNNNVNKVEASVGNYVTDPNTYYDDVENLMGNDLLLGLHDLMFETHETYTSYDDVGANGYQKDLDPYPGKDGYIIGFYSHRAIKADWDKGNTYNREHVWAQSLSGKTTSDGDNLYGTSGGGADMHHIRPEVSGLNSSRGNKLFGEVSNGSTWDGYIEGDLISYYSGNVFEPHDEVKGDVARIVMYMYMHYNTRTYLGGNAATYNERYTDNNKPLIITNIIAKSNAEDCFNLLLEWNELDPVDNIEETRNEAASKYQGNRNPFIDHPEYAEYIWGDQTIVDKEVVGMEIDTSNVKTLFNVGDTFTYDGLEVSYVYDDNTTKTTSDYEVIAPSLDSKGVKTVTVNSKSYDFSATYNITVTDVEIPSSGSQFEKITNVNQIEDGQYLIVNENHNVALNSGLSSIDVVNNYVGVTINDNIIAYDESLSNAVVTITKEDSSNYSIQTSLGTYIYGSSTSNKLNTSSSKQNITIAFTNDDVDIYSNQTYLRFNSSEDQMRFRFYKEETHDEQEAIQLYKYVEGDNYFANAIDFAKQFNNKIDSVCDYNGNTDIDELNNIWLELKVTYLNLDQNVKNYLTDDYGLIDDNIYEFLSSYDYIVNKYLNLDDYLLRRSASNSNNLSNVVINNTNSLIIIIVVTSTISLSLILIGVLIFKNKKKNQQ